MYYEVLIDCANLALSPLLIGSIIGGLVSLIGHGINAWSTKKTNQDNLDAVAKENQKAREFEEQMYNKYESVPAQAQQMREAGLNPIQAVSPQAIGHASTSAPPPAQAPQFGNALIESFPAFLEAGTTLRQQRIQRQEEIDRELENWRKAFDNGNAEEQFELQKQEILSRTALTRADKRKRDKEIDQLELTYRMAKEAYDNGANPYQDSHNESVERVNKIKNDINLSTNLNNAQIALINAQTEHEKEKATKTIEDTLLSASQRILNEQDYEHRSVTYPLEQELLDYSKSLGASQAQEAQVKAKITEAWSSPKWKDVGRLVLDFIHNNLNLSGGGNISKSYK